MLFDDHVMISYAKEVIYSDDHWRTLRDKRVKGLKLLEILMDCGYKSSIIHGSIARGDVSKNSDIDVALLYPYPIGMIKICLEENDINVHNIRIVQPTPRHTPKVYMYLDPYEEKSISIPLAPLENLEIEYYRFSGYIVRDDIIAERRVSGVNKNLLLIIPTDRGHIEMPVLGNEGYVCKVLGVSIDIVKDRTEALIRRSREGHTGLFIDIDVPYFEEVEQFIEKLCISNMIFRRAVAKYGLCT
ncbi:MAG: nucleotidyltransferase domain-containing protein [Ignisphaera sp.]